MADCPEYTLPSGPACPAVGPKPTDPEAPKCSNIVGLSVKPRTSAGDCEGAWSNGLGGGAPGGSVVPLGVPASQGLAEPGTLIVIGEPQTQAKAMNMAKQIRRILACNSTPQDRMGQLSIQRLLYVTTTFRRQTVLFLYELRSFLRMSYVELPRGTMSLDPDNVTSSETSTSEVLIGRLMFEGLLQPMHLIVILAVGLFAFGPKKLPELGKSLGDGIRGFKAGLKEITDPEGPPKA
jgi:sec-independent protein translocase protein TatA